MTLFFNPHTLKNKQKKREIAQCNITADMIYTYQKLLNRHVQFHRRRLSQQIYIN